LQKHFLQDWQIGDHGFCLPCKEHFIAIHVDEMFVTSNRDQHDIEDVIHIPLPIDPMNPERGLMGLLLIPVSLIPLLNADGTVFQWETEWIEIRAMETVQKVEGGGTVTLSLLRALKVQVEKK